MTFFEKIRLVPNFMLGFLMGDPRRNGEYRFLHSLLKSKTDKSDFILFDVGANLGNYALYSKNINSAISIHCFEPVNSTFSKLVENLKHLNVITNNQALSNTSGIAKIFVYSDLCESNSIDHHPHLDSNFQSKEETISVITLDDYCKKHQITYISFLKIDVEGHEVQVLEGAKENILNKTINVIQFEYNKLWKNTQNKLEDAFNLLNSNYDIYRLTPWGKIKINNFNHRLENFPIASNYVGILKS